MIGALRLLEEPKLSHVRDETVTLCSRLVSLYSASLLHRSCEKYADPGDTSTSKRSLFVLLVTARHFFPEREKRRRTPC